MAMDQTRAQRWSCTRQGDDSHAAGPHDLHEGPAGFYSEDHGHCNCAHGYDGHGPFACPNAEIVVLHCNCGDPSAHLPHHCPEATVHQLGTDPVQRQAEVVAYRAMLAARKG